MNDVVLAVTDTFTLLSVRDFASDTLPSVLWRGVEALQSMYRRQAELEKEDAATAASNGIDGGFPPSRRDLLRVLEAVELRTPVDTEGGTLVPGTADERARGEVAIKEFMRVQGALTTITETLNQVQRRVASCV